MGEAAAQAVPAGLGVEEACPEGLERASTGNSSFPAPPKRCAVGREACSSRCRHSSGTGGSLRRCWPAQHEAQRHDLAHTATRPRHRRSSSSAGSSRRAACTETRVALPSAAVPGTLTGSGSASVEARAATNVMAAAGCPRTEAYSCMCCAPTLRLLASVEHGAVA
eukprot:7377078-Prymnesium_polylepis.1